MPGRIVSIPTLGGSFDAYVSHPDGPGPWPAVVSFHDGLGLRATLERMADRLARLGYFVVQPNLFWRVGAFVPFDPKTVFSGAGPEFDRVVALVRSLVEADVVHDTEACLDYLARETLVTRGQRGFVGYCLGGGLALGAACHFPERAAFAASFHGGGLVVEDRAPALVRERVRCEVYLGVAEVDRRHTAATSAALEEALRGAGVPHRIELYAGTSHGFCVPDLPPYDTVAAERHWSRLDELVRRNLR